jgi:hypothetical protein
VWTPSVLRIDEVAIPERSWKLLPPGAAISNRPGRIAPGWTKPRSAAPPTSTFRQWMVLQLDAAEDPRSEILHPERYAKGGPWKDLRGTRWSA